MQTQNKQHSENINLFSLWASTENLKLAKIWHSMLLRISEATEGNLDNDCPWSESLSLCKQRVIHSNSEYCTCDLWLVFNACLGLLDILSCIFFSQNMCTYFNIYTFMSFILKNLKSNSLIICIGLYLCTHCTPEQLYDCIGLYRCTHCTHEIPQIKNNNNNYDGIFVWVYLCSLSVFRSKVLEWRVFGKINIF